MQTIVLAGGCFWGMQSLFDKQNGIVNTRVGYTGGDNSLEINYENVKTGTTGHAEVIEVIFNNDIISLRDILGIFFQIHDPTTLNRQANDIGSQYRSAVFYSDDKQKELIVKTIMEVDNTDLWGGKIVTEVVELDKFFEADEYHQNYLQKNPDGYICHFPREDWLLPDINNKEKL